MAEERKNIGEMTVAELRARASELEITGRSTMNKDELRQAVADAEIQIGGGPPPAPALDRQASESPEDAGEPLASEVSTAPTPGPRSEIEKEPPEEAPAKHQPSEVDAMGLDKRRPVVGKQYGASFAKQATVYGIALAVIIGLVIGGKLAADELDQGPEVNPDKAPWSQADAEQRPPPPIDFPRNPSP